MSSFIPNKNQCSIPEIDNVLRWNEYLSQEAKQRSNDAKANFIEKEGQTLSEESCNQNKQTYDLQNETEIKMANKLTELDTEVGQLEAQLGQVEARLEVTQKANMVLRIATVVFLIVAVVLFIQKLQNKKNLEFAK
jgi:hypothetical protein